MSDPVVHHVLFYDYVEDALERRAPYRNDHLALAQQWHDDGKIVLAGALGKPPHGGMLVFLVDDPAEIEAFVAADPYVTGGIVTDHRVVPWTVVVS
ncbi:MAG: YciI family protein [Solirubrobacteraceae bacterium]